VDDSRHQSLVVGFIEGQLDLSTFTEVPSQDFFIGRSKDMSADTVDTIHCIRSQ
jgi:hypothetical protein